MSISQCSVARKNDCLLFSQGYAIPETGKATQRFCKEHLQQFGTILCSSTLVLAQVLKFRISRN